MALLYPQTAPGQSFAIPAGTQTGHVLVTQTGCTFTGAGMGRTVLRCDGTYSAAFYPSGALADITIADLTIDADDLSAVVAPLFTADWGIASMTLRNVEILNVQRFGLAIANQSRLSATDVRICGLGGGINSTLTSTSTVLRGVTVKGCGYGFVNEAGAAGTVPGIDIDGMNVDHGYYASPLYERCRPTAIDARGVSVVAHVEAARSTFDVVRLLSPVLTFDPQRPLRSNMVQLGDRVETASAWSEVVGVAEGGRVVLDAWRASSSWRVVEPPAAYATLYRLTLGRLFGRAAGRLDVTSTHPYYRASQWRTVRGAPAAPTLAAGARVDIIRHGIGEGQTRDVDTGGVHVTSAALGFIIRNVVARRGFSDQITLRGVGGVAEDCRAEGGQDMGFTVDASAGGPQVVRRCRSHRSGIHGFFLGGPGNRLEACEGGDNGRHGYGYGVGVYTDAADALIQFRGAGNALGNISPLGRLAAGGFPPPPVRPAPLAYAMKATTSARRGRR